MRSRNALGRSSWVTQGEAMNALNLVLPCLALAGSLAAPSRACAHEPHAASAAAAASPIAALVTPALRKVDPLPESLRPSAADLTGVVAASQSQAATEAADAAALDSTELLDEDPDAANGDNDDGSSKDDGDLKPATDITVLPQTILRNLGDMPIVGDVLITPVTRGYTIVPAEGLPAVTFTVKPTKVTRGNGLVAIAHF